MRLTSNTGHLVSFDKQFLLDRLHGVDLVRHIVLDQVHFAVGATAYCAEYLEIALLDGRLLRRS